MSGTRITGEKSGKNREIFFGLMSTIVLFHTEIIQFQAADSSLRDDSAG